MRYVYDFLLMVLIIYLSAIFLSTEWVQEQFVYHFNPLKWTIDGKAVFLLVIFLAALLVASVKQKKESKND